MVSVFMLTYNQEEFISQAIDGVLSQKTSFKYQLVIGEDCSTDGTREICQKYAEAHPEKIKLILNDENIGLGANYVKTYAACRGKYVAICDGDDYWTDPLKLQKQVDFLESNSDYDVIFTNNENLYPAGKKHVRNISKIPGTSSFRELVFGNYIASVTVLFRKRKLSAFLEDLIKDLPYGDWPTYLWVTKEGGKIHFLNDVTSVYRKDSGTSAVLRRSKSRIGEVNLTILQYLKRLPEFVDFLPEIEQAILKLKTGLMASYFREDKISKSIKLWFDLKKKTGFLGPTRTYIYLIKLKLKKKVQKI
ncbi:glycosyltransferase [Salinimicrobium gaetbulicola]|uniref:Glycosyltransferase n=1 Tax=Salinimicrobium gaetbulicola TaxID=999702 RepID=A0ABW3IIW0_9FLAO